MKKTVLISVIFLLALHTAVFADDMTPSVTVQGSGRVSVTPDLGTITFAVTEEGKEAGEVQNSITEKANAVSDALAAAGLPDDQFQTSGVQLYTRYDYSSDVERIAGYQGQVSMSVIEISVDEIGKYLQLLSDNGVNQIDGISVFYSGYDEVYNEALGKAMLQARQKAEAIAGAEGARITGRFSAEEGYQNDALRGREKAVESNMVMAATEDAASGSLDFSVGTTQVEAVVTVCFEIETAG